MNFLRFILPLAVLLIALPDAEAQRGGRSSGNSRSRSTRAKQAAPSDFSQRLWYGAGGTLGFTGGQDFSQAAIGLIPQVGYKFNNWFSAGPRAGVTWNYLKGTTTDGSRQRSNTWSFTGGLFARARVLNFYAQTEAVFLSDGFTRLQGTAFGQPLISLDPVTGKPEQGRQNDSQWLIGAGFNSGIGQGISSDFGVFYNILDDVTSTRNPFQLRIMMTFNY